MNATENRFIPQSFKDYLKSNGARPGDSLILDVFQERKKAMNLTRKKYEIHLAEKFDFETLTGKISLPRFGNQQGQYELRLVVNEISMQEEDSRYLLRSLSSMPFKVNGVISFESFVEKSDIVEIGYNKIHFKSKEESAKEDILISDSIVKSHLNIFIEGETGTGKTSLAKKIHDNSLRQGSFVHLNLSSFSANLIESEIFGHIKGSFTGAINNKRGAIQQAHKGTLFLDEIDSLNLDLQTKLLLFLDNFEYRSVGSEVAQKSDVRLIVASGQNLLNLVNAGKMRKDFYFRIISGHTLKLKSLRDDNQLILEACREYERKNHVVIEPKLVDFYLRCAFPGNYRQLISLLDKKRILSNGKKLVFDESDALLLDEKVTFVTHDKEQIPTMEEVKRNFIFKTYYLMDENIYKTAKALDMSPNTIKSYLLKNQETNK